MTDKAKFFKAVRPSLFGGRLTAAQVQGMELVLDATEGMDVRWRAYALATDYHETGRAMQPVEENLNYSAAGLLKTFPKRFTPERAREYARQPERIANYVYANRLGNGPESSGDGWRFRGRGLVQITFRDNYKAFGIDHAPELALEPARAVEILVRGMVEGTFTGYKLADFFTPRQSRWPAARNIVNGMDKADQIAGYAKLFYAALT